MIEVTQLEPRFVKTVPRELERGVLYVSMEYGTIVHSCCCGCGEEVVTPLTPTDWRLEFDGEHISLRPSIGNWNLPCRSHYIIRRNRVIECADWSDEDIAIERRRDAAAKRDFYAGRPVTAPTTATKQASGVSNIKGTDLQGVRIEDAPTNTPRRWWASIRFW